jgi:hypothetical protein
MVNELHLLYEALDKAGISPKEWNRQFKELRKVSEKSPFFRLWISNDSTVCGIDEITKQNAADVLRKWEPSNGNSFPAFNMPRLYFFSEEQICQKDIWISGKEAFNFSQLKSWCTEKANNWDNKAIAKLEKCMHDIPAQLLQKLGDKYLSKKNVIVGLAHLLSKLNLDNFRKSLEKYVFEKLKNGEELTSLFRFMFPPGNSNDIQVIFDVQDYKTFAAYPVVHEKTMDWLNSILNDSEKDERDVSKTSNKHDAFGDVYFEINEPMPSVKLPGKVGEVKLRAMYHEHLCQYRYQLIDDISYPISKENRVKIKKSLEWLKEPDREGKTWGMVDTDEIIFAYPSIIPQVNIKFASLLGASGGATPEKFESIATDVIQSLKGITSTNKPENVQIFAIRKMDKARSKVVYYRNYDTDRIIRSAKIWQKACANIPSISFRGWPQKLTENMKPDIFKPEIPMPLQVAKITNKIWKMTGTIAGEVKKIKYYQGLELLLENKPLEIESYLLGTLLANITGLILYLGNCLHTGKALQYKPNRENYVFTLPLLGLLLYKHDCYKEDYMENVPYLFGQILKISDELHAMYCKVVRKGEIPTQLAGNALVPAALETPERAFALLGERMIPYIAWAKQYQTKNIEEKGKESWRARWYLGLYAQPATILGQKWDTGNKYRFSDSEKAQLFIGYLADFPKKAEDSAGNITTQTTGGLQ